MQDLIDIIESWHDWYGIADKLRCSAMQIQQELPSVTSGEFAKAAEACGYNGGTARRCWAYVKAQG
jgi:hypothetical protein